jgi:hypothetical protein
VIGMGNKQPRTETKDFKVHIPLALHYELYRHRLTTGESISHTVSSAIEALLDRHGVPQQ